MPANVRNDTISRSLMFLFLGVSLVLLLVQWRSWVARSEVKATKPPASPKAALSQSSAIALPQSRTQPLTQSLVKLDVATTKAPVQVKSTSAAKAPEAAQKVKVSGNTGEISLVVDLSDRRVYVYQGDKVKVSYPLAVGQEGWETPAGSFQVIEMQQDPKWLHPITREIIPPGPDNPLGKRWVGFWSDGKTHLGFHGTNQEELIGQAVSHGCLRMRNQDVIALYSQVSTGTPVTVRQ